MLLAQTCKAEDGSLNGAQLFGQHCAICHQGNGAGSRGRAPPLIGAHWAKLGVERGYMPMVVLNGMQGELRINDHVIDGFMPSFADKLNDNEIASILNFVVRLQMRDTGLYNGEEVAAARRQQGKVNLLDLRKSMIGRNN